MSGPVVQNDYYQVKKENNDEKVHVKDVNENGENTGPNLVGHGMATDERRRKVAEEIVKRAINNVKFGGSNLLDI